ncbi:MAG: hypothetical protein RMJ52_12300 [Gemmataceae bacterium]|nr:hypothetical protein [Gemmataceae bacterium]
MVTTGEGTIETQETIPQLGAGIDFTDPNSPLAPWYFQTSHVCAGLLLLCVGLFAALFPVWHTDIWAHMKFGEWIWTHGRLPSHEPFSSFADQQAPYINYQWLSQTGFYLLYHAGEILTDGDVLTRLAGGAEALRIGFVGILLLRCWFLLLAYRRHSGSLPLACVGLILVLVLSHAYIAVLRPQMLGELFFAVLLCTLSQPTPSTSASLGVPLLFVLWVNTHGSYPLGLTLLAVMALGRVVDLAGLRRAWADQAFRRLAGMLLAALVAGALVNPHGPALYLHTVRLAGNANVAGLVEWQPLGRSVVLATTFVALALTFWLSPRPIGAAAVLVVLVFGGQACLQQRMMVWWLTLVPWLLLPHWKALGEHFGWAIFQQRSVPSFRKTLLTGALVVVGFLAGRWLVPAARLGEPRPLDKALHAGTPWRVALQVRHPETRSLPALAQQLQALYPEGRFVGNIFASETQGDFLVWALGPDVPVLLYTHVHLFPPQRWQECLTVKFAQPGWREVLDRNGINLIVFEAEVYAQLRQRLLTRQDWVVVLDETGLTTKPDPRGRLFVALRRQPLPASPTEHR